MDIFNNYDKPGKGINKNEPEKLAIITYLEITARKFWKFIQAGTLFSLLSIVFIWYVYV